jgi:quercetin dioxygenase-like cupin family protein
MIISDINKLEGKKYPARRWTRNLVGGAAPIQAKSFCTGYVVLEPNGGQVPWHNQEQEEVYFIVEGGPAEMCLGEELEILNAGQAAFIPPTVFHQLTNISDKPLTMMYVYGPAGDVSHWRQELDGTLPRAGVEGEAPALPTGAQPQCTKKPE